MKSVVSRELGGFGLLVAVITFSPTDSSRVQWWTAVTLCFVWPGVPQGLPTAYALSLAFSSRVTPAPPRGSVSMSVLSLLSAQCNVVALVWGCQFSWSSLCLGQAMCVYTLGPGLCPSPSSSSWHPISALCLWVSWWERAPCPSLRGSGCLCVSTRFWAWEFVVLPSG